MADGKIERTTITLPNGGVVQYIKDHPEFLTNTDPRPVRGVRFSIPLGSILFERKPLTTDEMIDLLDLGLALTGDDPAGDN